MIRKKQVKIVHICCGCSRIMDKKLNYHNHPVEDCDGEVTMYSHSICPACAARLYPDVELYPDKDV